MRTLHRLILLAMILYWCLGLLVSGQQQYPGQTPPAGYNQACEADPYLYQVFGPFCLHPVYWDIPNYVPRGQAIGFVNPLTGVPDIGRVTSYYWNNGEYVYQALVTPSVNPMELRYVLVPPGQLIPLSQLP